MSRDLFHNKPQLRIKLFRFAFFLGATLPYSVGMVLGFIIAIASWLADSKGRSIVRKNLRTIIPSADMATLERTVRRSYVHCLLMLNETFRMNHLPKWFTSKRNIHLIDPYQVLKDLPLKGPAIICTIHCNWELLLAMGYHHGISEKTRVVSRSNLHSEVDDLFDRMRSGHGASSLLLDKAPLASLRALRDGEILGIVADRDYTGNGLLMEIAGRTMPIPVGPAALSVQTGAPIIPMLLARRGTCSFSLVVAKPLKANQLGNKAQQMPELLKHLTHTMDRFIHAVPSQWMAFHDLDQQDHPQRSGIV